MTVSSDLTMVVEAIDGRFDVLLDFDGVVADTEPLHLRAYQDVLSAEFGVDLPAAVFARDLMGRAENDIYRRLEAMYGAHITDEAFRERRLKDFLALVLESNVQPTKIARSLFQLRAANQVRVSIITSQTESLVRLLLHQWSLAPTPPICSAGDLGVTKETILENISRYAGVDPLGAVLFDDSQAALHAAAACGIRTVGVEHALLRHQLVADAILAI